MLEFLSLIDAFQKPPFYTVLFDLKNVVHDDLSERGQA